MMSDKEIYDQLKEWYTTKVYHDVNSVEHKECGIVAHEMLLFYNRSFCFWKKELINALKSNDIKDIKLCINEVQNKIIPIEAYKSICNELDRTR